MTPIRISRIIRTAFDSHMIAIPAGTKRKACGKRNLSRESQIQATLKTSIKAVPSKPAHHGRMVTLKSGVPRVMVARSATTFGSKKRSDAVTRVKVKSVAGFQESSYAGFQVTP